MMLAWQAKFKLPRHETLTKQWESMWRPVLHNVLVIAFGVAEMVYLSDAPHKKDSNHQATVLSNLPSCCSDSPVF